MVDLKTFTAATQRNCHISDARFAGQYTLCIFLLKMREYYRWERGIPLTAPLPRDAVGAWLTTRERFWEELEDLNFDPLPLQGRHYDPFDNTGINAVLNPLGYVYSGGIGLFHKPHFFLGKLMRSEQQDGIRFLVSGEEYARDLVAPPAMLLGDTVFIRTQSLRRAIWERIEEWRQKQRNDTPMARALARYGANTDADMESALDRITRDELETVQLHETGEAQARRLLGGRWEVMLDSLPRSRAELLARAVRDHLADCLATLPALTTRAAAKHDAALHFYFANFTGLRQELFPAALTAYQHWVDSGSLASLEYIYRHGAQHWQHTAQQILQHFSEQPETLAKNIETLCSPLNTPPHDEPE